MESKNLVIVIPAYEPNKLMLDLLVKLNEFFSDFKIVIVNDGSKTADETFKVAMNYPNVMILNHLVNKGKGADLKTAFKYIKTLPGEQVIFTADADGQHKPEDIYKVYKYYNEINEGLVLGSRQFDGKVPFRSRFGNDATKFLYRLCNNKKLYDNQTGLRAFGSDMLDFMINVEGERYEYEMNMLMQCAAQEVTISEVGIETVYINNNESSHFNPVKDFLKICKHLLKYAIPAFITLIADVLIFLQLFPIFKYFEINNYINVFITSLFSNGSAFVVHLLLNKFGFWYGNKSLLEVPKRRRKYIMLGILAIISNTIITYGLYCLLDNVALAKLIFELVFVSVVLFVNYFLVPKTQLH